ncbi:MAG: hypothetical protein KDB23_29350, partial [Planctomycetales bacterium]|nr:hypothetical protein [Planctomycetales bacterium]
KGRGADLYRLTAPQLIGTFLYSGCHQSKEKGRCAMSTSTFSRLLRLRASACLLFAGLLFYLVSSPPNVFMLTLSAALSFVLVGTSR